MTETPFTEGFGRKGRLRYFWKGQSFTKTEAGDPKTKLPYRLTAREKANQHRIIELVDIFLCLLLVLLK